MRTFTMTAAAAAMALTGLNAKAADIVDTAAGAGNFDTLVAAVEAAGLVDTLKSEGPFTVFAPTDEAFAKLPEGTVDDLLKPENQEQLRSVLTYHVITSELPADNALGRQLPVETVEGGTLQIDGTGGSVMINDAQVVEANIQADNGIIHVIDTVLIPEG